MLRSVLCSTLQFSVPITTLCQWLDGTPSLVNVLFCHSNDGCQFYH